MQIWTARRSIWTIVGLAILIHSPSWARAQVLPIQTDPAEAPANSAAPLESQPCGPCGLCALAPCECRRPGYFRVIPYGWVPGVNGDLTVRGLTTPVDASIGKVFDIMIDSLDIGGMGQVEASNGTFGVIFNGIYADVSPSTQIRRLNFATDFRLTILDLVGTYEPQWLAERLPSGARFELLAGVRYYALATTVTVTRDVERQGPLGREIDRSRSVTAGGTEDWLDAIVGARFRLPLTERLTGQVRGDVGGFGISGSSRFSWNVEATLEYRCSCHCSLFGGYRWLDIDYQNDSSNGRFGFDANLNGPVAGIAFNF